MATDRDTVLEAAVGVLSRRPTAHLDEIARAAGISRATLHRLFPGREALIREVGLLGLRRFAAALDTAEVERGDAEAALRRLVDASVPDAMLCAFLAGENQLYENDDINDLWEVQIARLHALFLRGQQQGAFRIELSAAWLSEAFFDLVAGVGWAIQDGRLAPRDAAFSLAELFLGGALRRPDARTAAAASAGSTTAPGAAPHVTTTHGTTTHGSTPHGTTSPSTADHRPDTDKP
ncbi:TetR/AcrR family transcriptional regulator [Kitasatospora sp. NPDC001547]|uniref:TetR/AcrR family transcriptional regulator n=1 Tax=Kitasatospora sp. NPDC001547 TaxID=3364015 RepID=UPI0036BCE54A